MSTHCAPCIADLALLREATTTVSGTAACVAHAVLLLHPGDTAQQRLARLAELRSTAEGKMATASSDDIPALELLIQEYALAGAMDMTVPLRDLAGDRTPRPPKTRNRGRDRDRGERGERGERGAERGGRERGPRPERTDRAEGAPAAEAPATTETAAAEGAAPAESPAPVTESAAPVVAAPVEAAPPAPEAPATEAAAPAPQAAEAPAATPEPADS